MTTRRKLDAIGLTVLISLIIFLDFAAYPLNLELPLKYELLFIGGHLMILFLLINALFIGWQYELEPKKLKFGFDIHGLCDSDPLFFSEFSKIIINAGAELHVITGKHIKDGVLDELKACNIRYTHLFSIADYHKEKGTPMRYDEKGTPWIDNELWNRTKGEYCEREQIDLHLDDSKVYGQYFTTSFAHAIIKKRI